MNGSVIKLSERENSYVQFRDAFSQLLQDIGAEYLLKYLAFAFWCMCFGFFFDNFWLILVNNDGLKNDPDDL